MNSTISTILILNGLEYYKKYKSIQVIDVPFLVNDHINRLTCPNWVQLVHHSDNKSYVGSAEQSFLELFHNGIIQPSKNHTENNYMALTPCIRDEQQDDSHFKVFLKCELFSFNENEYLNFLKYASGFFNQYTNISISKTNDGYDINGLNTQIELGSYGKRTVCIKDKLITYSYGTAFAEPRLSYVIQKEKTIIRV